jgi:hypothetical protein
MLDEFLRQFPSVRREQAIGALEFAREKLLTCASCVTRTCHTAWRRNWRVDYQLSIYSTAHDRLIGPAQPTYCSSGSSTRDARPSILWSSCRPRLTYWLR